MTFSIVTLGCKTNQFESASMEEQLQGAGYTEVPFEDGADLVLVNTCTVTSATDSQSRKLIRRARRYNPDCRIVVTGCYAQVKPGDLKTLPGVSLVIGNEEKATFLKLLQQEAEGTFVSDIRKQDVATGLPLQHFSDKSRAFVQIQNGCDAFCSYCIIPYARGPSRSVLPEEIAAQTRRLVDNGYNEVVLTGIHIGNYGQDLTPALTLADLVRQLLEDTSVPQLRLGSIEPTEISSDLIQLVSQEPRICPHFHIPLQSGSQTVLQRMNRDYSPQEFEAVVQQIVEAIPDVAIGLDVICGFPGETGEEYQETFSLIEKLPVAFLHVFPFSRRPGTPADRMADQVPGDIARERAARIRELGERKLEAFGDRFIGKTVDGIRLGSSGTEGRALTTHYLDVIIPAVNGAEGERVRLKLTGRSGFNLLGQIDPQNLEN